MSNPSSWTLKGLSFSELLTVPGLRKLDHLFLSFLQSEDALLYQQLCCYREGHPFTPLEHSAFILGCAPVLEAFIAEAFGVEDALRRLRAETLHLDPLFAFKKFFVLREARRALKKTDQISSFEELDRWVTVELKAQGFDDHDRELAIARWGISLLENSKDFQQTIERRNSGSSNTLKLIK